MPALPHGWEEAFSRSTGERYYIQTATGESTFELPEFTNGEKLQQCVPVLCARLPFPLV